MAKKGSSPHQKKMYEIYRAEGRKEKNKARKLARHMKKHPNDLQNAERRPATFPTKQKRKVDNGKK